ncbi:MAG: hypothetical protein BGP12_04855 [Rhodospirillales bacterium 70-18]|nr:cytochrome c [Rhodospirillales bacterium]OJY65056.1 MAG: hypothetical protein BGP12_04855 [Rhodospirillales bacterium 70-18]
MKTVLLTVLPCLAVELAGGVGFIYSGLYDVAAVNPDNPVVAWAIHKASDRSVAARLGGIKVPPGLDAPQVAAAGGKLFGEQCVVCHGGPGLPPTAISQGLNPAPPNLFRAGRRVHMEEAFWFIRNGVKMTAMPSFRDTRSDEEIWSMTAFVRAAPGMSAKDFSATTGIGSTGIATPAAGTRPTGG